MRISINQIKEMKRRGEKISTLNSYNYATSRVIDEVGILLILVVGISFWLTNQPYW
jgi:ketopantoate hydroxymethyltransferase